MASDFAIRLAAQQVRHGGVIIYPTETVYGLGCDPLNKDAVDYINILKQRAPGKGLILIAGNTVQLRTFIDPACLSELDRLHSNDQPTSWIVPASSAVPGWLAGPEHTVAVRISPHPVVIQLCRILQQPLVSTSANPGGLPPATNILQAHKYFHGMVDSMLSSNTALSGRPSMVKRLRDNKILRK